MASPFENDPYFIDEAIAVREQEARIAELEADNERLRDALTEIASLTQTTKLLWWQKLARAALNPKETDE